MDGLEVWGMGVLLKRRGSVIPKALVWSLPCAIITAARRLLHQSVESEKDPTWVLGEMFPTALASMITCK